MPIITQDMLKPGVWLKSAGRTVRLRDGFGKSFPSKDVGPIEPVWFENLSRAQMAGNNDVFVLDMPRPGESVLESSELEAMRAALIEAQDREAMLAAENAKLQAALDGKNKSKSAS